jgi:hypothetical protein
MGYGLTSGAESVEMEALFTPFSLFSAENRNILTTEEVHDSQTHLEF